MQCLIYTQGRPSLCIRKEGTRTLAIQGACPLLWNEYYSTNTVPLSTMLPPFGPRLRVKRLPRTHQNTMLGFDIVTTLSDSNLRYHCCDLYIYNGGRRNGRLFILCPRTLSNLLLSCSYTMEQGDYAWQVVP